MPIQGEEYGSQDEQRIRTEYDKRFQVIEKLLGSHDAVAIRIDKEHTLDELVKRIRGRVMVDRNLGRPRLSRALRP